MKPLSILVAFFIILSQASAFTIMNIYVDEQGNAIFLGETDESPSLPQGISLEDGEITGQTSQLTSKSGELWTFSYTLPGSEINLILPEGAIIKEISNGEISLEGNRISIFFQDNISVKYIVNTPNRSITSTIIAIIFLAIIVISWIIYSKRKKINKISKPSVKKISKLDLIKGILNDREKLILDKLKETKRIQSSRLRKILYMPKASFSRHVQELEKKNLIKRTGEGKNKFIELRR